jgi:hypothetical protein
MQKNSLRSIRRCSAHTSRFIEVDQKIFLHKQNILWGQSEDIAAQAKRSFEKILPVLSKGICFNFFEANHKILLYMPIDSLGPIRRYYYTSSKILRGQSLRHYCAAKDSTCMRSIRRYCCLCQKILWQIIRYCCTAHAKRFFDVNQKIF